MGEETSVYKGNRGVSQKGKVMKILYYTWDEYCSYDIRQCFEKLGYEYRVCSYEMKNKLESAEFTEQLRKLLEEDDYDFIFSFAYFPVIAEAAAANRVKYVSWIYDSPLYSLYTDSVFHKYNYIFHFDSTEVERLKKCGVDHIYHMPLAVNADRLGSLDKEDGFLYDVSFVGKLYRDQYNFFDQIKGMPEYYKGYFDALIQTQMKLFGYNVIADVLTPEEFKKISAFIGFKNDGKMFLDARDMFINILEKKVTAVERTGVLKALSRYYPVTLFSDVTDAELQNVAFKGYVNYLTEMPDVFRRSRINLNITLRSIQSGIPLRCLDIMGAGGFLMSNYQPELAQLFENGREMAMYESKEDLLDKVNYYLTHEEERKEIAYLGREKVRKEYDYKVAVQKIVEIVKTDKLS